MRTGSTFVAGSSRSSGLVPIALLTVATLAGCAAAPPRPAEPLPFHVAVVPLEAPRVRAPAEPEYEEETAMRLAPDTRLVTQAVARALEEARFARVTLLDEPTGTDGTDGALSRDSKLVDQARAAGADLLLECDLSYDPVIWRHENPNFWLNWVLFLMGGPFVYFLEDHTYKVECELDGNVYDLHALDAREPRLGDRFSRVFGTTVSFPGVPLDFIDRADGVGDYALSLVCPAGYLAAENDELEQGVQEEVVASLSQQIAAALRNRSDDLFRPDGIVPFYIDPEEVRVEWTLDRELLVEGVVHLDLVESQTEVMSGYTLRAGEVVVEGEFGVGQVEQTSGGSVGSLRYTFREVVTPHAPPDAVQLELRAEERDVFRRSYTFPVSRATAPEDRR